MPNAPAIPPLPTGSSHAVLTVDLDAVAANYNVLKAMAPTMRLGAVMKADAYGCGAQAVARTLIEEGLPLEG